MVKVSFLVALTLIAVSNAAMVMRRYTDINCSKPDGNVEVVTAAKTDFTIGKCMGGTFNNSEPSSTAIDIKSKSCSSTKFILSYFAPATGKCEGSDIGNLTMDATGFKAFWAGKCAFAQGTDNNPQYQKVTGISGLTLPACFTTTAAPTANKTATNKTTAAPTANKTATTAAPTTAAPTVLTGSMNLKVPNATAFLTDTVAQQAVKDGIAALLKGIKSSWIALVVTAARRLEGFVAIDDGRRLNATNATAKTTMGVVKVAYTITIPANAKDATAQIGAATTLSGLTVAALTTSIKGKLGAGYEAMSVVSKTDVANSKPAKNDTKVSGAVGMFIFGPAVFLVVAVLHQVN